MYVDTCVWLVDAGITIAYSNIPVKNYYGNPLADFVQKIDFRFYRCTQMFVLSGIAGIKSLWCPRKLVLGVVTVVLQRGNFITLGGTSHLHFRRKTKTSANEDGGNIRDKES